MSIRAIIATLQKKEGISLLEVVIFVALLSIIILAIVFSTTQSLKRTQYNVDKLYATRYAEELEEWLRGEKEVNWSTFSGRSPGAYCVNSDLTTCSAGGTCWDSATACSGTDFSLGATGGLNNGFKRQMTLTTVGSRVDVSILVEWVDGPNTFDVRINSSFSRWE